MYIRMALYDVNHEKIVHANDCNLVLFKVLEIRSKWWMNKCPSGDISRQTISALLRRIFGHINTSVTALCVCVSNEQLVVLSQMSDPDFFGSDKMPKGSENV